jgi:hypothetical protein
MYPSWGNSYGQIEKTLEIPLEDRPGRKIYVLITYQYEGDTNATIYNEENAVLTWVDTGEDLTADELNTVVYPNTTLFEWIMDNIDKQ